MLRLATGAVCAAPNLAWYGNSNAQERRRQQVDTAHPTVESIYARHCPKKAASAIKDLHKPGHAFSRCLKSDITEFTASDRSQTVPNSLGCWGDRDTGMQNWPRKSSMGPNLPAPAGLEYHSPGRREQIQLVAQRGSPDEDEVGRLTRPGRHIFGGISRALS